MKTPRITIDHSRREVFINGAEKHLPPSQYAILHALMESGKVMSRAELSRAIGYSKERAEISEVSRIVDQYVARTRRLLGSGVILTVPTVGYKIAAGLLPK